MNVRISNEWRDKLIAAGFPKEELCLGVAEEILRRLPDWVSGKHEDYDPRYRALFNWLRGEQDTLADASAAMYCHLLERSLLLKP